MKTKIYSVFLLLCAALVLYSCSSSKDNSGIVPQTGDYSFTISNDAGSKLIDGTLTILNAADGKVDGSYKNSTVYDSTFTAYNLLRGGKFSGTYKSNGDIGFNMNPRLADNNVYIGAKLIGDNISGNWTNTTMTGVKSTGKFSASLK
jgi:hypothetical protein